MNNQPINKVPTSATDLVEVVALLSSIKLSSACRTQIEVLAEECLNPEFLEDAGIETLEAVLEDLVERFEIHLKLSKDNLRDTRGAIGWKSEADRKSAIAQAIKTDRALKDGLSASELALNNLRNR
jgi:hypothetical protein